MWEEKRESGRDWERSIEREGKNDRKEQKERDRKAERDTSRVEKENEGRRERKGRNFRNRGEKGERNKLSEFVPWFATALTRYVSHPASSFQRFIRFVCLSRRFSLPGFQFVVCTKKTYFGPISTTLPSSLECRLTSVSHGHEVSSQSSFAWFRA